MTYIPQLLHKPFFEVASRFPDLVAVIHNEREFTYNEIARRAISVSKLISNASKRRPGEVVAVIMEKCAEQIVAVLGILNAGCAYLPIMPDWPAARINYMLKDARAKIVVTQKKTVTGMKLPVTVKTIIPDEDSGRSDGSFSFRLKKEPSGSDLAYVIYTSGSSGKPKGVMITHKGVYNTVTDINTRFRLNRHDRILALSELSFDLSVYDIFGPLSVGGAVVMPRNSGRMFPKHWYNLVKKHNITIWNSVPAFMTLFMEVMEKESAPVDIRLVMLSGDWIPVTLPSRIREEIPSAGIVSMGGATEASIWSIIYPIGKIDPGWGSIPYGKALNNQTFYVLNSEWEACPEMVTGKLYIGGDGLAVGYLNNKKLTEKSFIIHPKTKERIYDTGDIGRYLPDGNIEFMGREDFQVKISGFRIELQEIEYALNRHPLIKYSCVMAAGPFRNKKKLVAYIVKKGRRSKICDREIAGFLRTILPEYMVPAEYRFITSLPLSANGKVDRSLLT